jgi:hypothetical protein
MFSRASAFSNTQRIERSSSTIQTGFMAAPPGRPKVLTRPLGGQRTQ